MLAAKYRLKAKENFQRVEQKGQIFQSSSFGVAYLLRGDNEPSCFAAIVSKKVSADATTRNRIKRAILEAVRLNQTDLKNGFDVVFLVKTGSLKKPTGELMTETKTALKGAGIIN